jgi:hypothetical protein
MSFADVIQRWFKEEWGGSLHLPDGWYGRPYDNQHTLTSVSEYDDTITLVLDEKLTLYFEGLKAVSAQPRALVLGHFAKLRVSRGVFATDEGQVTKEYQEGEVKLVSGSR